MIENWKIIEGFNGRYEVSDHGNVRNKDFQSSHKIYGISNHKSRIRPILNAARGYSRTVLTGEDKKTKYLQIHRLVAMAFIPNPEGKPHINHKDCDKKNNHVSNLEWCTNEENREHAIQNGLIKKGDQLPQTKILDSQKSIILDLLNSGLSQRQVANQYNVCQQTISKMLQRHKLVNP